MLRSLPRRLFSILGFWVIISGCASHWLRSTEQEIDAHEFTINPVFVLNGYTWKCLTDRQLALSYSCTHLEQKFRLKEVAPRVYNLVSQYSDKCFSPQESSYNDGVLIAFKNCDPKDPDQELVVKKSNTDPLFLNLMFRKTGKCLDIVNRDKGQGVKMHQWACHGARSQEFYFVDTTRPKKVVPRKIWTYWDKGESKMPEFYKTNLKHWRTILQNHKNPKNNWEIRVTNKIKGDPNYFGNFISDTKIPTIEYLQSRIDPSEKKLNANVVFSDFVRLDLLDQHGGVWMDPSIMLHKSLDDLANLLEVMNQFQILGYTSLGQATKELRYGDSLENFFLMTAPKTELLKAWRKAFHKYWDEKKAGMAIENHPMFDGSQGPKVDVMTFGDLRNYLNQHLSLKYALTTNSELRDQIFVLGSASSEDHGAFTLLQQVDWSDQALLEAGKRQQDEMLKSMRNVLMSKFPSDNSRVIRDKVKDEDYFFKETNIFGRLNAVIPEE